MAHWLGSLLIGRPLQVIHLLDHWPAGMAGINYSKQNISIPSYHIWPHGLLAQNDIQPQLIDTTSSNELPAIFKTPHGHHAFDILAASFYLLSRYEEYLPDKPLDAYGRFSHTGSILYRQGWIKRPIVDEWVSQLKAALQQQFPACKMKDSAYRFTPTYDVDIAWSYRHKGWKRTLGGLAKDVWHAQWQLVAQRLKVLMSSSADPFDRFEALQALHTRGQMQAKYFMLVATKQQGYDKNISPHRAALKQLIKQLHQQAGIGLHASWAASLYTNTLAAEKKLLEQIVHQPIASNRMHYLNFSLPVTYEQLLAVGITSDYSMGYGDINGFRAGTSEPFFWYHLTKEEATPLQIFPFAWMDANSRFEQKDAPDAALQELQEMQQRVQKTGGHFISICHNHLMGSHANDQPWWSLWMRFLNGQMGRY